MRLIKLKDRHKGLATTNVTITRASRTSKQAVASQTNGTTKIKIQTRTLLGVTHLQVIKTKVVSRNQTQMCLGCLDNRPLIKANLDRTIRISSTAALHPKVSVPSLLAATIVKGLRAREIKVLGISKSPAIPTAAMLAVYLSLLKEVMVLKITNKQGNRNLVGATVISRVMEVLKPLIANLSKLLANKLILV